MRDTPALAVSSEIVMEENGFSLISFNKAMTMHSLANKFRLLRFSMMLQNDYFLLQYGTVLLKIKVIIFTICNVIDQKKRKEDTICDVQ